VSTIEKSTVFVVEDFQPLRHSLVLMLERANIPCEEFECATDFIKAYDSNRQGCLVFDLQLPDMTGLQLHSLLMERGCKMPFLIISGRGSIVDATNALRDGAIDFLQKPFPPGLFLDRVREAFRKDSMQREKWIQLEKTRILLATLTTRQQLVLNLILDGRLTKQIANQLDISVKTVESHRSQIAKKLGVDSAVELVKMVIAFRAA